MDPQVRDPFFRPQDPEDAERYDVSLSPIDLRDLRSQVRYTAGLISTFRPVYEELSSLWAADIKTRRIFWRATNPYPPFDRVSPRDLLFFIGHEAGHLNFTGGYETPPDWPNAKRAAFHLFWNCVEDIRIERLMAREFPGFGKIRRPVNRDMMAFHDGPHSEQYPAWIQVGFNWMVYEDGPEVRPPTLEEHWEEPTVGTRESREFAASTWPAARRIANADTSNQVAQALIPIFEHLWRAQEQEEQENSRNGDPQSGFGRSLSGDQGRQFSGAGDGFGEEPSGSPHDDMPHRRDVLTKQEELEALGKASRGDAKRKVEAAAKEGRDKEREANEEIRQIDSTTTDVGIGRDPDHNPRPPADYWLRSKAAMDPYIRALSHRLRSTLKTNLMSDWSEGLKRGGLNPRRARRAVAGNNRIFRKRRDIGSHDYTFGIVCDVSGSMRRPGEDGRRLNDHVLDTCVLMAESLDRAGMNVFIVAHESILCAGKAVRQRLPDVAEQIAADINWSGGGTYEAPALVYSQEQFRQVRSGHKVLFVLSDGQTHSKEHSEQLVRELMREGVRVIGIGLNIDPPDHHPHRIRVDSAAVLPSLLPRLVNEVVRKGGQ